MKQMKMKFMKIPIVYDIEKFFRRAKAAIKFQEEYFAEQKRRTPEEADTSEFEFSDQAIKKLLSGEYEFETVLDIGCGAGEHSDAFIKAGKKVTAIDYGDSVYFKENKNKLNVIIGDFNEYNFQEQFDCVWCSHVLEHQPNTEIFLKKMISVTKDNGIIAITIPPYEDKVLGGHINPMNIGILMYNLICCGLDCSQARIKAYGFNRSLIVRKNMITDMPALSHDCGDIQRLWKYFPQNIEIIPDWLERDYNFDGNILSLNWD